LNSNTGLLSLIEQKNMPNQYIFESNFKIFINTEFNSRPELSNMMNRRITSFSLSRLSANAEYTPSAYTTESSKFDIYPIALYSLPMTKIPQPKE